MTALVLFYRVTVCVLALLSLEVKGKCVDYAVCGLTRRLCLLKLATPSAAAVCMCDWDLLTCLAN